MNQPKIILDTNVLVSAMRSRRGASFRLLSLFRSQAYRLAISVPLILEYEDVLGRHIEELLVGPDAIDDILDQICAAGEKYEIHFLWRPILPDPKDDHLLELAVVSQAKHIVTYNLKDFAGVEAFGVHALTPGDMLRELGAP
jgi:putative PIN family toxin of toxin-antitoxin system